MDALDQLLEIINNGVAEIKRVYASADRSMPSLDEPYDGPDELERATVAASTLVAAAAQQLIATLRLPSQTITGEHILSYVCQQ
jgi:hypothetical protein